MKQLIRKTFIILIMTLLSMIILVGESNASLQANPNTHYKKKDYFVNWIRNIRYMEKSGEAMGLSETFNEDLTSQSESNNIDVHFIKSTEYGAVAILSASGYGNPQTLQESTIKTTTGNKTGVYFSATNWENVAGGIRGHGMETCNIRYYDAYESSSKVIIRVGDALGNATVSNPGCAGWHGASYAQWVDSNNVAFLRGGAGLFSFARVGRNGGAEGSGLYARGVAVCGKGL